VARVSEGKHPIYSVTSYGLRGLRGRFSLFHSEPAHQGHFLFAEIISDPLQVVPGFLPQPAPPQDEGSRITDIDASYLGPDGFPARFAGSGNAVMPVPDAVPNALPEFQSHYLHRRWMFPGCKLFPAALQAGFVPGFGEHGIEPDRTHLINGFPRAVDQHQDPFQLKWGYISNHFFHCPQTVNTYPACNA
jgi:hypothetical protein